MTARKIDSEFQSKVGMVMSRYGDYKAGPIKKVERCQSKLENEYQNTAFPKAASILDLVRCSVSFNTVEQLIAGFDGLSRHIQQHTWLELIHIRNGFLPRQNEHAFRDIKVCVIFRSKTDPRHPLSMICEIQMMLNRYSHEKKRSYKLYSILRERSYFEMAMSKMSRTCSSKRCSMSTSKSH